MLKCICWVGKEVNRIGKGCVWEGVLDMKGILWMLGWEVMVVVK